MSEEEWLNVGTTFQASEPAQQSAQELAVIVRKEKKHKKRDKDKDKQQKQIVIEITSTSFDINKEFAYKQDLGNDLLQISLVPFGDQKLLQYGHTSTDIPLYSRSKDMDQNYQALRYFDDVSQGQAYKIRKVCKHVQQDYIEFNNELYQEEEESNEQIIRKNQQLQSMLQQDPHNLEGWKELLLIQDKLAATQGYDGDRVLMANRRLSIIGKLEQSSELLADHPWVLVYKITLMEQFEELQDQIGQAYEELFAKYYHIRAVWVLYLEHRIRCQKFSSTLLRVESQRLFIRLQQLIQQSTRPQVIQVLKRIYLELVRLMAFYEYQMGYKERATAILQALCELNLFAPASLSREYEIRLEEFKKYYDAGFRTGETKHRGWDGSNHQRDEFIGNYEQLKIITEQDPIEEFIQYQNVDRWRPANQNWEDVSQNIDSVVIYEEVEPYLMIFNDQESKLQLLNSLFELLGFPDIFDILPNKLVQYDINEYLMKFELKINNLSKWIYIQRLLEQLNYPEIIMYKLIVNEILNLNSQPSQYKQILKDNQNNLLLWILHAEFEEIRTNLNQDKLYQQIFRYAKSKKQKMMIYYFQFIKSQTHSKKLDIIKSVISLYDDTSMSHTTLILKLRQFISVAHPTKKPKKHFFQLSKKSMLLIFVMYLEQFQIESFIQTLAESTENNLIALNLLRFASNKEPILRHMKDNPFFFHQYVSEILPKYLYFHKLQPFTSIQQKLCIAQQIHKQEQKKGFLINLDKSSLAKLFCDAQDQENFDAFETIKMCYQLDLYISQVSNVGKIYQYLKSYPYSVDFYRILIKEIQEYKEAIDILNEMSERELKYV